MAKISISFSNPILTKDGNNYQVTFTSDISIPQLENYFRIISLAKGHRRPPFHFVKNNTILFRKAMISEDDINEMINLVEKNFG